MIGGKYSTLDLSVFDMQGQSASDIVNSMVNANSKNRSDRRKILKALGKYKNREQAFAKKQAEDTKTMRIAYQKELDSRIDDCEEQVAQGLSENWLKLTALMGLTLKRKYNWSNGRISAFIEKSNEMHLDMLKSGEWDNILKLLDEECDVQLEVGD